MRQLALALILLLPGCAAATPVTPAASSAPQPAATPIAALAPDLVSDVVPPGSFVFFEDFEAGTGRWQLPAAADLGWRLLKAHTCTGEYSLLLGKDGQAPFTGSAQDSYVTLTQGLDLSKATNPLFKYDVLGKATPDGAVTFTVEVRAKGGDWKPLGEPRVANHAFALTYVSPLTEFAGQTVDLRFHGKIDQVQEPSKGLYLDQVAVIEAR
jgi:hypothetical protein